MFTNSNFYLMLGKRDKPEYQVLTMDKTSQNVLATTFTALCKSFLKADKLIKFNGKYKPEQDELLYINNFNLNPNIINCLENSITLNSYTPENKHKIRSVFSGYKTNNSYVLAFQYFHKEQHLTNKGWQLFYSNDTFSLEKKQGISILNKLDCLYKDNTLYFKSFVLANRILNLSRYYRIATNEDLQVFSQLKELYLDQNINLKDLSDTIIRRKIAELLDYNFFTNFTVNQIKKEAKNIGYDIHSKNNKIVIPNTRKELKTLVKFLSNEVYKGAFDKKLRESNSSRYLM